MRHIDFISALSRNALTRLVNAYVQFNIDEDDRAEFIAAMNEFVNQNRNVPNCPLSPSGLQAEFCLEDAVNSFAPANMKQQLADLYDNAAAAALT